MLTLTAVALILFEIYPCQNEYFASDIGVFRSCDSYFQTSLSNLQRLCGFIWLFLIHVNYYCFHSLKLCNIYPRSIKSLLGIVLTVTNLTKVIWSFTTIDLLITIKVLFWTWFFKITLTASTSIFNPPHT